MSEHCRILVVYYTRSGTTRRVAEMLASELDADIEPIREQAGVSRTGARGYFRSLIDALCHRRVEIMPSLLDVSFYDAVIVGAPVWAGGVSAPAQTWLEQHGTRIQHLALFCCLGISGSERALEQMARAAQKTPFATCAITARDLYRRVDGAKRDVFVKRIRHRMSVLRELEWMT
ncbi:flavodoxin family protein [Paraburkholderia sp. ZP32-5]|uniref:flavodoxin family protein n=1 Tax=Paraburkholderia sp. ZP32-5 TaxID=2883245 RepID=UPI001F3FC675|nr:flavodoxin [Paraburkholderia sp. ZP32-5]